jgi:hypothetical protein
LWGVGGAKGNQHSKNRPWRSAKTARSIEFGIDV